MNHAHKHKLTAATLGFLYVLMGGAPALADDTEIFFAGPAAEDDIHPNVLFILDTSGSMGTTVTGTGKSRMENMKEALREVLDATTNVNVGLMRFNDPGGPILYPATYIDKVVTTSTTSTSSAINSRVAAGTDDAVENGSTVDLTGTKLNMAYGTAGGAGGTYVQRISSDNDDAEETISSGSISRGSNTLNMDDSQINALRFQNVTVPKGATIVSAKIQFRSKSNENRDTTLRFHGEASDNASAIGTSNKNISNRTKTSASVDWETSSWSNNGTYDTPDLSNIVREIVNRTGWSSGNAMVFLQTHVTGDERRAVTHDDTANQAPELTIVYSTGTAASQIVGLRFLDVAIPQGATVTSAVIEFTAAQSNNETPLSLTVRGEAVDDAATYQATSYNLSSRTLTSASSAVTWTPDAWAADDVVQTADLTNVVQEIANRSGWCGNNAMAFQITGTDAAIRSALSYEGDASRAPILRVTYDPDSIPSGGGCLNRYLVYRVSASNDDAEQTASNGDMSISSSQFDMRSSQINGLRFDNVMINKDAEILEASLEFTARDNDSGSVTLTFKAQASDDAGVFTSASNNISSRATTGSVTWTPSAWSNNNVYKTPELKSLVQAVVNRGGWTAGNALAFIQSASGSGVRAAHTFDSSPGKSALLRLKVKSGGVATSLSRTVRDELKDLINDFTPGGYTPIVDTLYEGAMYYRSGPVTYGTTRGAATRYGRVSSILSFESPPGAIYRESGCTIDNLNASACATEAVTGSPNYVSPITDTCQASYIVLLTDGQANHNHSQSVIRSLMGTASCTTAPAGEECGRDLVGWLSTTDQTSLAGTETVKTYTVGFNLDQGGDAEAIQFLRDLAQQGQGSYESASTAAELAGVFRNILGDIQSVGTTFVSPGVAVNQFNRLTHQNQIYFSVFRPYETPRWEGNLKKYQLGGDPITIQDAAGSDAIDPSTGYFRTGARSFWSSVNDGDEVALGGAAQQVHGQIASGTRNVYTYTGTDTNLAAASNKVHETNTAITRAMLGADDQDETYRQNLLKWARGLDIDTTGGSAAPRDKIGDPLHSVPVIITYGGTAEAPDNTVFFGANDGFLHAIDGDDGTEVFSFTPQELLPIQRDLFENRASTLHPYGMDGPITPWVKDVGNKNVIESGDFVYLYAAMRRGGRNLYALDVTNRTNPALKWTIFGGAGDYAELGQTWSRPIVSKVRLGGTVRDVLIFAGGYDDAQDTKVTRSGDTQGRAIFIVDAADGTLVWSGGPDNTHDKVFAAMQYSIPSDMRVLDVNGDGLADQMYVGDMGGQVWRFDVNNGATTAADLVTGGVIADLGGNTAASNRRFFYAPDLALISRDGSMYLSISIGSGWRSHPLDTVVDDRFYVIRNSNVFIAPASYTPVSESNLYDATANVIGEGNAAQKATALEDLADSSGWYIRLENNGEKVLAEAATINNQVVFTTYEPNASSGGCSAGLGLGRAYVVSVFDATPVTDFYIDDGSNTLTGDDRAFTLKRSGIPPAITLMIPDSGNGNLNSGIGLISTDRYDPDTGNVRRRTFWRELSDY